MTIELIREKLEKYLQSNHLQTPQQIRHTIAHICSLATLARDAHYAFVLFYLTDKKPALCPSLRQRQGRTLYSLRDRFWVAGEIGILLAGRE
jgi:hypothetical protein